MIYFSNYKIGLEDIGRNNEATNKALLAIMQDIACLHSASVGYGVLEIETKKRAWMLLDWKMEVIKRPKYNTDRRRPVRLTADSADLYESETDKNVFLEEMEDIKCGDYLFKKDYCIQRRDIDINQHMHNLSYLDMAYEILPDNIYNNKVFNNIRIVYKKEILYGENVECYYEEQNNKHIITAKSQDNINAIIELS